MRATTPPLLDGLATVYRSLSYALSERLAEEATTEDQWRILRILDLTHDISMGELSQRLNVPGPSLTRFVDQLVDNALVYRVVSPQDRRKVGVFLTEKGASLLERLESIVDSFERQIANEVGPEELALLKVLLARFVASIGTVPAGNSVMASRQAG